MQVLDLKEWICTTETHGSYVCHVPASLYSVLLEHGSIDDPNYRSNEAAVCELSRQDCCFETTFDVDAQALEAPHLILRFEGLDTVCDIYLNHSLLGHTENMHRTWEYDVRSLLRCGQNTLRIHFFSPIAFMEAAQKRHFVKGNDMSIDGVAQIRKASYMMGWDWGPQLPDMGIWRPVKLLAYRARICDVAVSQIHRANRRVSLRCKMNAEGDLFDTQWAVQLKAPDGSVLDGVITNGQAAFEIDDPKLWWPNGYGEQPLYCLTVLLLSKTGEILDQNEREIGLRTVTVSTEKDRWGREFCFVINGEKIFSMGANYIPEVNILAHRSREKTERLLDQCIEANFNTIRIWGGGFYPDDCFFELCDRKGLLVWLDFMVACNNVWLHEDFETNICAEFEENLRRVRHHASLGILCGNNEMETAVVNWKLFRGEAVKADYLRLYEHLLPSICMRLAPELFYWSSSPSSGGGFDDPEDENRGDSHEWKMWHGLKPLEDYRKKYHRFCSEFGFAALPTRRTIEAFTLPQDRTLCSRVMDDHQKCPAGTAKLMYYLAQYYPYSKSFEALTYTTQMLQADAIRIGVEHFRRHRGRCMGAIYWQLNDCWPALSWASVDSHGRKKALHYEAKRFFAPVLLSAVAEGNRVTLSLCNERREAFQGSVRIALKTNSLETRFEKSYQTTVNRLSSLDVDTVDLTAHSEGHADDCFLEMLLYDAGGRELSRRAVLLTKPKHYRFPKPEICARVEACDNGFVLKLASKTFAKGVQVDFADAEIDTIDEQFFDLTDAAERNVFFAVKDPTITARELEEQLCIFSMFDIGEV